jgi:hypothetical protein
MKRKASVFFLVFCLAILLAAPAVKAVGNVCFTAINDKLMPLDNNTMPIINGSLLYVPCNFFTSDELGVYYIPGDSQVMLYSAAKKIIFYIDKDTVVGYDDNQQYIPAVKKNGLIYVPVDDVCAFFGLTSDVIQSPPAPVVRFYRGAVGYSKDKFLALNSAKMHRYYDEYVGIAVPSAPPVSPEAPTYADVSVYLSFYDLSSEKLKSILDTLASTSYKACFFVAADEIEANADRLRRAAGEGHTIGIWLKETTKEFAFKEYQDASALLFEAAQVKTVIVASLGDSAKAAEEMAKQKSLVFWRPTKSYDADAKFSVASLTGKLSTLGGTRDSLYFACSDETSVVLRSLLLYLSQNEYSVRRITETSVPVMTA